MQIEEDVRESGARKHVVLYAAASSNEERPHVRFAPDESTRDGERRI
jgi:hypothetical protein